MKINNYLFGFLIISCALSAYFLFSPGPNPQQVIGGSQASGIGLSPNERSVSSDSATFVSHLASAEYDIRYQPGQRSYQSPNRKQNIRAVYHADGFELMPREQKKDNWHLKLQLSGINKGKASLPVSVNPEFLTSGNKLHIKHPGYTVEYINSEQGTRQNFIISQKPEGDRDLKVLLSPKGDLDLQKVVNNEASFGDIDGVKLYYKDLHVWDANGNKLAAKMEKSGQMLALVVRDENAMYPITVDPITSTPDTLAGSQESDSMGYSVASAGDVNKDGYSDVIVSAMEFDNGQENEGAAFVYYGSPNGIITATGGAKSPTMVESNLANSWFGFSVSSAGDLNRDGYADVLVGAPHYSNGAGEGWEGAVYVYYGSANGLKTTPEKILEGGKPGAILGTSVSAAGDLNNDGFPDIVAGARQYSRTANTFPSAGAIFVFAGSETGLKDAAIVREINETGALFGASVSGGGDLNKDGYSDIVAGAPGVGATLIYYGTASTSLLEKDSVRISKSNMQFGTCVSIAGDIDKDGYADLVIGAPYFIGEKATGKGGAFIYYGSAAKSLGRIDTIESNIKNNSNLGYSVAIGDLDDDGFSDVILGAFNYQINSTLRGGLAVHHGTASGIDKTPSFSLQDEDNNNLIGFSVASAGDVNGDGVSDLITGSPNMVNNVYKNGAAFVYSGKQAVIVITPPTATTAAVTVKGTTTATLPGTVSDNGASTTVTFEYGKDSDPTTFTSVAAEPATIDARKGSTSVSADLTGLTPNTTYYYRVKAENSEGTSPGDILSFTTDIPPNANPTDLILSASSIDENAAAGTVVGTLSTTDADASDTHTYTLVTGDGSDDNGAFTLDGNSLKISSSPDFEVKNSYTIRIKTTDPGNLTYEESFIISINNVNEKPTDLTLSNNTVKENIASNSTIGTLTTVDPDASDTFTYSLVAGSGDTDNSKFSISGYKLTINASPDYETQNTYSVRIRTADQGELYYEEAFTITISDLTELIITPESLNAATVGSAYSQTITASTGASPYTYSAGTGLPKGLTLSSEGVLSGTPTEGGTFNFDITATDANEVIGVKSYTLTVNPGTQSITFAATASKIYGDEDFDPKAESTNSTIAITYSSSDNSVATIENNKVHIIKAGTVTIYADQEANASYNAATRQSQLLTISPKELTATAQPVTKVYDGSDEATINFDALSLVGDDKVNVTYTAANYDDKNVGTDKAITITGLALTGNDKDNYSLKAFSAKGDITAIALTATAQPVSKEYDGSDAATISFDALNVVGTEKVSVTYTDASYDNKNVGEDKPITITGLALAGDDKGNYSLNPFSIKGDITSKALTATAQPVTKVYDGSNAATIDFDALSVLGNEKVSVTYTTATYDNENVGTDKPITITGLALAGEDKDNYSLEAFSAKGDITAKALIATAQPVTKVYDGSDEATINFDALTVLGDDKVSVTYTSAAYDSKNVGTDKPITITGLTLAGDDKDNYSLNAFNTKGDITAKALTASAQPVTKVYDGTDDATISFDDLTVVGTENVSITYTAANYDNKNIGEDKPISITGLALAGDDKDNYSLNPFGIKGDITAKALTVTAQPVTKTYDGSNIATVTFDELTVFGDDKVSVTYTTATYDNEKVGTNKAISFTGLALAGEDRGNYSLNTFSTTGAITSKALTATAQPVTKVYDGSNSATLNFDDLAVTGDDKVSVIYTTATYDNENVGTGKAITITGLALAGDDKENYSLDAFTTTGVIAAKALTASAQPVTKIYDGSNTATITFDELTVIGDDQVSVGYTQATYDNEKVGTGKAITITGLALAGADKDNYSLNTFNTTGAITAKALTATAQPVTKAYDGSNTATVTFDELTVIGDDKVNVTYIAATYDNEKVGTNKPISFTGLALAGDGKDNYSLNPFSISGNITAKEITVVLNATPAISRVYNASNAATLVAGNYNLQGVETGDAVSVSGTASYDDKNVGTGKTITASNFVLAGSDKDNYTLTTETAGTTGSILSKEITLTLKATPEISKEYDADASVSLAPANYNLIGVEENDVLSVSGTSSFNNKEAGTGKPITTNNFVLSGTDKDNYNLTTTSSNTTGTITKKLLTIKADDKEKYQNTPNPQLTVSYTGFVAGESKADLLTEATASTSVVLNTPLGIYDIAASGASSNNYSFDYVLGSFEVKPGHPTSISLATSTVYENQPAGTLAGTLSSTSDDPAATFRYELVNGAGDTDNGRFSIVNNEIKTNGALNFEEKPVYYVRVRSTTQHELWLEKEFTISLTNVNEQPTLADIAPETICYTTAPQLVNINGISPGPDANQISNVSISSSNNSLFDVLEVNQAINGQAELRYVVNKGASGSAVVNVLVTDDGGTAHGGVNSILKSFTITVNPLPVVTISSDKGNLISKGDKLNLTATGGVSYQWSNAEGIIEGQNSATLTVRPSVTTTYRVTATSATNCSEVQEFTVTVNEDFRLVEGTNLVTPNGDNVNDYFVIRNLDLYPNNEVKIFDRAGRLLYSKKNYDDSWNGTFNGAPLAEDTYYYIVDFGAKKTVLKGFITIVRD